MFQKPVSTGKNGVWGDLDDVFVGLMLVFMGLTAYFLGLTMITGKETTTKLAKAQTQNTKMSKIASEYRDVRKELYQSLNNEFADNWGEWGSNINKSTLSIQFFIE